MVRYHKYFKQNVKKQKSIQKHEETKQAIKEEVEVNEKPLEVKIVNGKRVEVYKYAL